MNNINSQTRSTLDVLLLKPMDNSKKLFLNLTLRLHLHAMFGSWAEQIRDVWESSKFKRYHE